MYKRDDNKPKAVWNRIHNVTVGEGSQAQRYDFDLSEGGSVRVQINRPDGEKTAFMLPASQLEHVIAVQAELPRIFQAFQDAAPQILAQKEIKKEAARLEAEKRRELEKAERLIRAGRETEAMLLARIETLTGKKVG